MLRSISTIFSQSSYKMGIVLVSDILFQPITSNVIPTSNIDSELDTSEEFIVGSLISPVYERNQWSH